MTIKVKLNFSLDQYLIFLQVSSFRAGRVWTANCSFKAFFNQEFHILLQALREKRQSDKCDIDPVQYPVSQLNEKIKTKQTDSFRV